jgi:hypothetical protein
MKWSLAILAFALGACQGDEGSGFPNQPGGPGGSSGQMRPDAAGGGGGDADQLITGRVCLLVENPQTLATCAASGVGGLTVALDGATALTADDGTFTIARPSGTVGLVWQVSGADLVTSVMKFGATGAMPTLPAMPRVVYEQMIAAVNPPLGAGSGALMTRITRAGFAVSGATATTRPPPDSITFYDGTSAIDWRTDATGANGVAWIPSIGPGTVELVVTSNATDTVLANVPVVAEAITFVFAEIP